ncbi:MAG: hypothetical protein ACK5KU_07320 [Beutenbergiaceae bacterium]
MRRGRKRPYSQPHRPLDPAAAWSSVERTESGSDGRLWQVRTVKGADKEYRCPGCQQVVRRGAVHIVAWRGDHLFGDDAALAERRHWHSGCWQRR